MEGIRVIKSEWHDGKPNQNKNNTYRSFPSAVPYLPSTRHITPLQNLPPKPKETRRINQSINQSIIHIASSSLLHLLQRNLQRAQHETGKIDLEKKQNETKRNETRKQRKRKKVRSSNKNLLLPEYSTDVCEAKTGR
jgi:hypothetical protein